MRLANCQASGCGRTCPRQRGSALGPRSPRTQTPGFPRGLLRRAGAAGCPGIGTCSSEGHAWGAPPALAPRGAESPIPHIPPAPQAAPPPRPRPPHFASTTGLGAFHAAWSPSVGRCGVRWVVRVTDGGEPPPPRGGARVGQAAPTALARPALRPAHAQ